MTASAHTAYPQRAHTRTGWRRLAGALAAALLLHAALLSGWNRAADAPQRGDTLGAVSVRWVVLPVAGAAPSAQATQAAQTTAQAAQLTPPAAAPATPARLTARLSARSPHSAGATAPPRAPGAVWEARASGTAPEPVPVPVSVPSPRLALPLEAGPANTPALAADGPDFDPLAPPHAALAATSPNPLGREVPTYRTAWAPATTLHYQMRRGSALGQAQLQWRPSAELGRYELALQSQAWVGPSGAALKHPPMQWTSRGQFDAAGLAPERFTVARRGRDRHAANFQRDKALVTFAGPAAQWPLAAGMQDRMSWMLQLGAILQAQPELAALGQQLHLWVVGAHGDASVWTFTVGAAEPDTPNPPTGLASTAGMVYLQREAAHPHDTQVQVWLDPAQHHLPIRVVFRRRAGAESTELRLRTLQAP